MKTRFEAILNTDGPRLSWEVVEWLEDDGEGNRKGRTVAEFFDVTINAECRAEALASELQQDWDSVQEYEDYMNISCREDADYGC